MIDVMMQSGNLEPSALTDQYFPTICNLKSKQIIIQICNKNQRKQKLTIEKFTKSNSLFKTHEIVYQQNNEVCDKGVCLE